MSGITIIGLDLAKSVFHLHGADAQGHAVLRKKPRRSQILDVFGRLEPCVVAMGGHASGKQCSFVYTVE